MSRAAIFVDELISSSLIFVWSSPIFVSASRRVASCLSSPLSSPFPFAAFLASVAFWTSSFARAMPLRRIAVSSSVSEVTAVLRRSNIQRAKSRRRRTSPCRLALLLCVGTMDREFILQLFLILCEPRLCRRIRRLLVRRYFRRVLLIIRPEVLRILSCTPLRFLVRWEEVLALLADVDGGLIPDRLNFRGGLFVDPFFVGRGLRLERGSRCEVEVREASNFRIGQFPARSDVVPHLLEVHLNFRDDSADGIAEEEKTHTQHP